MLTLELSPEQQKELLAVLDVALRQIGLNGAQKILDLAALVQSAKGDA